MLEKGKVYTYDEVMEHFKQAVDNTASVIAKCLNEYVDSSQQMLDVGEGIAEIMTLIFEELFEDEETIYH